MGGGGGEGWRLWGKWKKNGGVTRDERVLEVVVLEAEKKEGRYGKWVDEREVARGF